MDEVYEQVLDKAVFHEMKAEKSRRIGNDFDRIRHMAKMEACNEILKMIRPKISK